MSSFLDWLGEDPETGEVQANPLQVYDSMTGTLIADKARLNQEKQGTFRGHEPVKVTRTDPLSDVLEIIPGGVGEGQDGPFEYGPKAKFALCFEFLDPDSPNAGRKLFFFKDAPMELNEDYRKSSLKLRKELRGLVASFGLLAEQDMSGFGDELEDEDWAKWVEFGQSFLNDFDGQECWLNYQVSRWHADRDFGKKFPKGSWNISEKPLRVTQG